MESSKNIYLKFCIQSIRHRGTEYFPPTEVLLYTRILMKNKLLMNIKQEKNYIVLDSIESSTSSNDCDFNDHFYDMELTIYDMLDDLSIDVNNKNEFVKLEVSIESEEGYFRKDFEIYLLNESSDAVYLLSRTITDELNKDLQELQILNILHIHISAHRCLKEVF